MWLVRKNKVLTKDNLVKSGWQGDTHCLFRLAKEISDHLFVQCPFVNCLW
jgi:zinc-binding in reverse transcriptase